MDDTRLMPQNLEAERAALITVPISIKDANEFVLFNHRHNKPVIGAKFAIACASAGKVVGVILAGRPVARHLDDGWTIEIYRCCTDGTKNAPSYLYGAAWRAARAMGYKRAITYIRESEPGITVKAAGFKMVGQVSAKSWNCPSRPRIDHDDRVPRLRFEIGEPKSL